MSDATVETVARAITGVWTGLPWDALSPQAREESMREAEAAIAVTRAQIASALDYEASVCPCAEDAVVIRDCAKLIRADFSYDRAEEMAKS